MSDAVVIERRFRGPPDSANGGYACGLLAAHVDPDPAVEVTLRAPPPLDHPLEIEADGTVRMLDAGRLVAEARAAAAPKLELPAPVSVDEAEQARKASPVQVNHAFPTCFVCGPDREAGDGLRVICGPVPGRERELVAAPFETDEGMAGDDGTVRPELVWSVLDCPSGLAGMIVRGYTLSVLGRLTGQLLQPLDTGRTYVAIGWPMGKEGRKQFAGSAILDREGRPMALAEATWIELAEARPAYGS